MFQGQVLWWEFTDSASHRMDPYQLVKSYLFEANDWSCEIYLRGAEC